MDMQSPVMNREQAVQRLAACEHEVRALGVSRLALKVPEDFRAAHPEVEWRAMAGMRDRLIHDYFGVDFELVWDVVSTQVPATCGLRHAAATCGCDMRL